MVLYMISRGIIYHHIPHHTLSDWFLRDCWMTLPRFLVFASLVLLSLIIWKRYYFDFHFSEYRPAILYGVPLIGIYLFHVLGATGNPWPTKMVVGGLLTTPFVGLCEEYLFRGIILGALLQNRTPLFAVIWSSVLFTVFHFQAKPLIGWPTIFLTGVVFANLRIRGISLFWLALIHTIIDTSYFFFGLQVPGVLSLNGILFAIGLLVLSYVTYTEDADYRLKYEG